MPARQPLRAPLLLTLLLGLAGRLAHAELDAGAISSLKRLNVEELLDIEVTSVTRRPEPLLTAPSAIQVITQAQIRRSGAATLAQALRLADNLQVARRDASGWAISARGFNTDLANKLLVMIDGRTVYTPLYSGVFWEAQDYLLEDIDRIEVISGPGGTLWGANAVNGVINVITKRADETQGLHAEAGAGSELDALAGLRYGGTLGSQVHYRVYGKYLDQGDSSLANGTETRDSWHRRQLGFRLENAEGGTDSLKLQGDYYSNHERAPGGGLTVMRGANLLGRWSRNLRGDDALNLRAYYDWTSLDLPVAPLTINRLQLSPAGTLHDDLHTIDLDFYHRVRLGQKQVFTWGAGFRNAHDVVANAPALAFLPTVLDQQLYSAFVQDELRLREGLSLTLGTKVEHNDYTGFELEPSARLQWQVAATQTAWAAISRAVRAPSRIDRDLYQAPPPYLTVLKGGPEFKSEHVVAYELGYRAQAGTRSTMSLSTFYNEYGDIRSTTITPATILPFHFENGLEGHTWGMEFSGAQQLTDGWSLHAGYNLLQEELRIKPGHIDIANARNEVSDPQQQAALRSSLDLPAGFELDVALRWVDTLRNSNGPATGNVPAYTELDTRLAWRASQQLELSIVGRNLLHDQHPEYGFPSATRTEIERSVFGKVVWRR
jgi:iron complex outermembrane receptor protein